MRNHSESGVGSTQDEPETLWLLYAANRVVHVARIALLAVPFGSMALPTTLVDIYGIFFNLLVYAKCNHHLPACSW